MSEHGYANNGDGRPWACAPVRRTFAWQRGKNGTVYAKNGNEFYGMAGGWKLVGRTGSERSGLPKGMGMGMGMKTGKSRGG